MRNALFIPWFRPQAWTFDAPFLGETTLQPFAVLVWVGLLVGLLAAAVRQDPRTLRAPDAQPSALLGFFRLPDLVHSQRSVLPSRNLSARRSKPVRAFSRRSLVGRCLAASLGRSSGRGSGSGARAVRFCGSATRMPSRARSAGFSRGLAASSRTTTPAALGTSSWRWTSFGSVRPRTRRDMISAFTTLSPSP